eukprot:scaffold50030_cov27-Tisochrysis_lutea.AAC.1
MGHGLAGLRGVLQCFGEVGPKKGSQVKHYATRLLSHSFELASIVDPLGLSSQGAVIVEVLRSRSRAIQDS